MILSGESYCEHNRRGILLWSLYGRFRVFTCALDKRYHRDWLGGWNKPCINTCGTSTRNPKTGERGFKFPYKLIKYDDIPFSDEALEQQNKERNEQLQEADNLQYQALELLRKADKLRQE